MMKGIESVMFMAEIGGLWMRFQTLPVLFSPNGVDAGTRAMLACVDLQKDDKVLDLGCGYGVVGIYAAKCIGADRVTMLDVDGLAVQTAAENAALNGVAEIQMLQSDGFTALRDTDYSLILSNPPYHTDFSVAKSFIEKGFNRLCMGGKMVMVTKRLEWYKNKFTAIFGGVTVTEKDGYYIFTAEKRAPYYAK